MTPDFLNVVVAWYGAILATAVAGFQAYQWWHAERTRFRIRAIRRTQHIALGVTVPDLVIEITNLGKATVLHKVTIEDYPPRPAAPKYETVWTEFQDYPEPLPIELPSGKYWSRSAICDIRDRYYSQRGPRPFVTIYHSNASKPARFPLVIQEE